MDKLKSVWRHFFDIRPGEYRRTIFMALYLLLVLCAYYVLKSASEAMFLNKFDIDKLPNLYILMAIFGGGLAYVYSKVAARTSLATAVAWTMAISIVCLLGMWLPLRTKNPTIVYVFAVWVRLFSVVTVTQGWVVASNLFDAREAKRVYGLLGMGMIVGAVLGGELTNRAVHAIGTDNLLFASVPLVALAYGCFLVASREKSATISGAKAEHAHDFSFRDITSEIVQSRHLQALITIMTMQFIVDTLIDYQFKYMAKQAFQGDALTAFLGRFYGRYLNVTEIVLQLFFTTFILKRIGVGGTLQVMPVSLAAASVFTFAAPSVFSASLARLTEASTRYTLARTANELFYMPLPLQLRNRIKAFIDIFVDRAARGISGLALILFTKLKFGVRGVAVVTIVVTVPWILLTIRAHREYMRTIRKRLEARRLDIDSARVTVEDKDTIRMLEHTAESDRGRQATYALTLLNATAAYDIRPLLRRLADSPVEEVRAKVYELARACDVPDLIERATAEFSTAVPSDAVREATAYVLTVSPQRIKLAKLWIEDPNPAVEEGIIEALSAQRDNAGDVITHDWIARNAADPGPRRRILAAHMLAVRGDQGTEAIHDLLADPDPKVASAACQSAAAVRNRGYVLEIARLLSNFRVRGAAIQALADYGSPICGTLGDLMNDASLPAGSRVHIPRALKRIPHQRSVDVLLAAQANRDPAIRGAALKALAQLRAAASDLNYENPLVNRQIMDEARYYYELSAVLAPFAGYLEKRPSALGLLARTVRERLRESLQRLFRLLGLRYSSEEMHWTYLALANGDKEKHTAALEFLDNLLDKDLKRVLIPLLESEQVTEEGRRLFGVEPQSPAATIAALQRSGDRWLTVCAEAAAGEMARN
jgi:AAA family ATP:ADP antiporter